MSFTTKRFLISPAIMLGMLAFVGTARAENSPQQINAVAGKEVCREQTASLGNQESKVALCVTEGTFAHDSYVLKIDGKTVLKGIDDETTKGISADYKNEKAQLTCAPLLQAPDAISEDKIAAFQKTMPNLSHEEAKAEAIKTETVEVGRKCEAHVGTAPLINMDIVFD